MKKILLLLAMTAVVVLLFAPVAVAQPYYGGATASPMATATATAVLPLLPRLVLWPRLPLRLRPRRLQPLVPQLGYRPPLPRTGARWCRWSPWRRA